MGNPLKRTQRAKRKAKENRLERSRRHYGNETGSVIHTSGPTELHDEWLFFEDDLDHSNPTVIRFECATCHTEFNSDIIKADFSNVHSPDGKPSFERNPQCPQCGDRTVDQVYLTEIGQGQLTRLFFNTADK